MKRKNRASEHPPAGRIAYVNGAYIRHGHAKIHIEDRGLQFADAIYEVFGVTGGHIRDEEEHLDRLERSQNALAMPSPMGRAALKCVLREIVRRNHVDDGLIYLQQTRGTLRRDHGIPVRAPKPNLFLTARRIPAEATEERRTKGVHVVTLPDERWGRCDIKSTALLANILAKTAARRAGAFEAWLVDTKGFVTEGSSTTAWIVDPTGAIVTRNLGHAILPGTTRQVVLRTLEGGQPAVTERAFTVEEAYDAREAFLTAATIGVIPVIEIDGHPIGTGQPGPVTRRVAELYRGKSAPAPT